MPYDCPSPGDCEFRADDARELGDHVSSEHAGEFRHPEWPDTAAGRAARRNEHSDENSDE